MSIRIIETGEIFNCDFEVITWKSLVQLTGSELPTEAPHNFEIIEQQDEEIVVLDYYYGFDTIYDKGDGYIQITNDTNTYYTYLLTDDNGFVTQMQVTASDKSEGYLYQLGQGKQYKEPTLELFDADGAPLYKIVDGELVETTDAEKRSVIDANYAEELKNAKIAKQAEISSTCEALIVKGVEINGESFAYELDDQNNILNNTNLALQTGLDVPYHADGKPCRLFTPTEIASIYIAQEHNLTHNITYNNQLKLYVDTLTTVEEVNAVQYGQELTGNYLSTYQLIMAQADALTQAFINGAKA